jgi:hypothetical protein
MSHKATSVVNRIWSLPFIALLFKKWSWEGDILEKSVENLGETCSTYNHIPLYTPMKFLKNQKENSDRRDTFS